MGDFRLISPGHLGYCAYPLAPPLALIHVASSELESAGWIGRNWGSVLQGQTYAIETAEKFEAG
jgi:hypothetical protein